MEEIGVINSSEIYPQGFWLTYSTMYALGSANIVSFLSFTLCIDYFSTLYPEKKVGFVFPIVFMTILLIMSLFILYTGRITSINFRIFCGLGIQILGLSLVPLSCTSECLYHITLLALIICSLATATVQSSAYGLAGVFGKEYVQALEAGKGAAGVLLVIVRCLTKWQFLSSPENINSIYYFFGTSQILTIIALGFYSFLFQAEFTKSKFIAYKKVQANTPIGSSRHRLFSFDEKSQLLSDKINYSYEEKESFITTLSVFYKIRKSALSLFCVYAICLGCFPGLTTSIVSVTFNLNSWFPILLVASFNSGDYLGKTLAGIKMCISLRNLHIPILLEFCFLPLFAFDVYKPFGDILTILMVFALGNFTGYIGCAALMIGPSSVSDNEKELAGIIGSLFLISGLFVGAYLGLALDSLTLNY